ncbi:MAG: gluconate:H+ symporter [Saprospiraceae bacterium]
MGLLLLAASIACLLALIILLKINAFLALTITAIATGLWSGMAPVAVLKSIQDGIGGTLGGLALVIALGITLGSILVETGAAQVISTRLLRVFGVQHANWAVLVTGLVVGIAMFYNAGFVVLAPLVFSIAAASGQSLVALAISMAAPLSVTHGFLPPHPGATAIALTFQADLGKTLLLGLIIGVPTVVIAGILLPRFFKNIRSNPPEGLFEAREIAEGQLPGFAKSLLIALTPVVLMAAATLLEFIVDAKHPVYAWAKFFGDPVVSLLFSVLLALALFSKHKKIAPAGQGTVAKLMNKSAVSLGAAAMLLLIIAAGGAYKQVLLDSGLGNTLAGRLTGLPVSPLVLGWAIATLLRIAVGSATVAGMTAAGLVLPLLANSGTSPELMTLAIGAGSLMCSHVNDTGFWMFKEWFGLSLGDTLRTWTVMETLVGVLGLVGVLILNVFIG